MNKTPDKETRNNIHTTCTPDCSKTDLTSSLFSGLMPLMNTAFKPGTCMETIRKIEDPEQQKIALAEYSYFSGHPKEAADAAEHFLTNQNIAFRLSACLIYGYANLSLGEIHLARHALAELKQTLISRVGDPPHVRAIEAFATSAAGVLLHLPLPEELPELHEYLPLLPPGIRIFALYVQAHYTYLQKDYSRSLGIVDTALAMQEQIYPIPSIYMHLVAVMDYMSLKQTDQAEKHLLAAWDLARPDDLIEGFGEHHGLLGGMLEAVIKKNWPDDFRRIIAITYQFSAGWRKIHNPMTGHDVADNLTTTEFTTAMLAARGWTNQEISQHLQVSVNTVKGNISSVLQKLHIKQRQDLKDYMLR